MKPNSSSNPNKLLNGFGTTIIVFPAYATSNGTVPRKDKKILIDHLKLRTSSKNPIKIVKQIAVVAALYSRTCGKNG